MINIRSTGEKKKGMKEEKGSCLCFCSNPFYLIFFFGRSSSSCDWYVINLPDCSREATLKEPVWAISNLWWRCCFDPVTEKQHWQTGNNNNNDDNNNNDNKNKNAVHMQRDEMRRSSKGFALLWWQMKTVEIGGNSQMSKLSRAHKEKCNYVSRVVGR